MSELGHKARTLQRRPEGVGVDAVGGLDNQKGVEGDGPGAIADESRAVDVEVGKDDRARPTLFEGIPGGAVLGQVGVVSAVGTTNA
ncbi:MAG: hypothetical protein E6G56_08700 [Actinobacteria bacterium]|nr:MAG: hypothetical protein E6G56_08700 [Actinomycetota bacterium]